MENAEPLQKLLNKDVGVTVDHRAPTSVSFSQGKIASPPVLDHFDPNMRTYVTTDASNSSLGTVLLQHIPGFDA